MRVFETFPPRPVAAGTVTFSTESRVWSPVPSDGHPGGRLGHCGSAGAPRRSGCPRDGAMASLRRHVTSNAAPTTPCGVERRTRRLGGAPGPGFGRLLWVLDASGACGAAFDPALRRECGVRGALVRLALVRPARGASSGEGVVGPNRSPEDVGVPIVAAPGEPEREAREGAAALRGRSSRMAACPGRTAARRARRAMHAIAPAGGTRARCPEGGRRRRPVPPHERRTKREARARRTPTPAPAGGAPR